MKRLSTLLISVFLIVAISVSSVPVVSAKDNSDVLTLRISNCEEYIDEGGWNEEEDVINLDSGDIFSDKSMIEEFEDWYYKTYGKKVKVEYSTYGTNEDLYNQITLGDRFDLVCPSDYMCMKMIGEGMAEPLSKDFFDTSIEENYYAKGVSPYIKNLMETTQIDGEKWSDYSAAYMWGTMGIVYNREKIPTSEISSQGWGSLWNSKYSGKIQMKDSVRDSYAAAALYTFKNTASAHYDATMTIAQALNATTDSQLEVVKNILIAQSPYVYGYEVDTGKTDIVLGDSDLLLQWSGDAVYTLSEEHMDECEQYPDLAYYVP